MCHTGCMINSAEIQCLTKIKNACEYTLTLFSSAIKARVQTLIFDGVRAQKKKKIDLEIDVVTLAHY